MYGLLKISASIIILFVIFSLIYCIINIYIYKLYFIDTTGITEFDKEMEKKACNYIISVSILCIALFIFLLFILLN